MVLARVFRSRFIAGGFSFFGMLAILFSGLKLTGYIDWEWIWVLAPLWIPFVLGIAIVLPLQVLAKVSRSRFR
ncbi:MAG: hypothetical protein B7Y98_04035 [Sphingomonas sp. 32-62-10]|nr:MAG: hypothetical protein B7Z43_02730 [Sphingomonas sp. 12-62-6]OYX39787.1 MAG: hypothetical protein B7Y98_04035 [Sphingomonas sp. 32-62-10]OYY67204.1 MAG: hypothetical protein B7Y49_00805 [Sphingomonas sp. 28-62-11]